VCFSTRRRTLLGSCEQAWHAARSDDSAWADSVVAGLGESDVALGALSFAPGAPAVMHRLGSPRFVPTTSLLVPGTAVGTSAERHRVTELPAPETYADQVRRVLAAIEDGDVEKVVLGRNLEVRSEPPLEPGELLAALMTTRPGRYVFTLPAPGEQTGATLLGASPELLVRRRGTLVEAMPLAGSVPRSSDPEEDERRRVALGGSSKDLREHAHVVEDITARLAERCSAVEAAAVPEVVGTDALWHLGTRVRATVEPGAPGTSALHLAQLVHPTPAVGGTPRTRALEMIEAIETVDRGPLAGAVGWVGGSGDGEFALTLRSGLLHDGVLRLFAGAGIVAGSDPDLETRETGAKLRTMLKAVGL
jgi:isochorismate synthase